jgi:hypothetical protein
MENVLMIAPLETLKQAVSQGWSHMFIGALALEAEEMGVDAEVISRILSGLRKRK